MNPDANPIYNQEYESDFLNALDNCIDDFWEEDSQEAQDDAYLSTLSEEERDRVLDAWQAPLRAL